MRYRLCLQLEIRPLVLQLKLRKNWNIWNRRSGAMWLGVWKAVCAGIRRRGLRFQICWIMIGWLWRMVSLFVGFGVFWLVWWFDVAPPPPAKDLLEPDESIINPFYMRQLLEYGIKLGSSQTADMDPDSLLREAEVYSFFVVLGGIHVYLPSSVL